ncbi:ankyrin repeat domain-containing protein 60-like [Hypomesus transpacificus]|uniref:ankyrin repeat domain-containing protein 60-like n=1 Tax=Hypomesus transpacificus TaxID=137520 RepID=UPI001F082224|nr:ankyrin repeat domain-containing protein 60-like [Hypomesus transpacificus]
MIQSLSMSKSKTYFSRPPSASNRTSPNLTSSVHRVSKTVRFYLNARVRDTGEVFMVPNCHHNMTIRELKCALELAVGIPADFQRLCYLDQGDLMEESTLHYNDIVPGTVLTVGVWPYNGWPELVTAAASGNTYMLKQVMSKPAPLGSSASSWLPHRLFSALFITVHRGHTSATRFLLQQGADVGAQTPRGRGALHAAAAQGHVQLIQDLLLGGAPPNMEDCEGMTALSLAEGCGQKKSARQIFLFNWQQRAAAVRIKSHLGEEELFDHQRYNSHLKTWRCGTYAQRYMAHLGV